MHCTAEMLRAVFGNKAEIVHFRILVKTHPVKNLVYYCYNGCIQAGMKAAGNFQ